MDDSVSEDEPGPWAMSAEGLWTLLALSAVALVLFVLSTRARQRLLDSTRAGLPPVTLHAMLAEPSTWHSDVSALAPTSVRAPVPTSVRAPVPTSVRAHVQASDLAPVPASDPAPGPASDSPPADAPIW
jgi:hypothetical protein